MAIKVGDLMTLIALCRVCPRLCARVTLGCHRPGKQNPARTGRTGMANLNTDVAMEVTAVSLGQKVMTTGAVAGGVGWLTQINWMGLIGTAVAVLGFAASVYFQVRKDRREARESEAREARKAELHEAQLRALRDRCDI